jgi:CBS domain containing-hemolysin-like protein
MTALLLAIFLTCAASFICSLWEAMILSTTVGEIEGLKKRHPKLGQILERLKNNLEETSSGILTLNTIANTLGSVTVGGLATRLYGSAALGFVSAGMTVGILVFSEVIPKNLGVVHRRALQPAMVVPLAFVIRVLRPVTYLCGRIVRLVVGAPEKNPESWEEIRLLAERGARHGELSQNESDIIANALRLDEIRVASIMTPRNVIGAVRQSATIADVFRESPNVSFGRMPVYGRNLDDIVGLVRRRDLLKAKANDQDADLVSKHMQPAHFIPETVTAAEALRLFLETHQRLLIVIDEFGSTSGVLSLEDVMETLLGREIFEKDDVAVDMRELARVRVAARPRGVTRPAFPHSATSVHASGPTIPPTPTPPPPPAAS